jgi:membrane-anchored glycerophosphoryl diester phosphodiesterase (GDPDase)
MLSNISHMKNSLTLLLLVALIFTCVTFPHFSQLSLAQNRTSLSSSQQSTTFPKSFENLVNEAHNLTRSYQNEVANG